MAVDNVDKSLIAETLRAAYTRCGAYLAMSIESRIESYRLRLQEKRLAKPGCCQVCKRPSRLRWHGGYTRTLIGMGQTFVLPVKRLLCVICHHTFALLPDFIEKFHRYAKEVIRSALRWLKAQTYEAVAEMIANAFKSEEVPNHDIAPLTLYLWRRKFA